MEIIYIMIRVTPGVSGRAVLHLPIRILCIVSTLMSGFHTHPPQPHVHRAERALAAGNGGTLLSRPRGARGRGGRAPRSLVTRERPTTGSVPPSRCRRPVALQARRAVVNTAASALADGGKYLSTSHQLKPIRNIWVSARSRIPPVTRCGSGWALWWGRASSTSPVRAPPSTRNTCRRWLTAQCASACMEHNPFAAQTHSYPNHASSSRITNEATNGTGFRAHRGGKPCK